MNSPLHIRYTELAETAESFGLRLLAIVKDLTPFREVAKLLTEWQAAGFAGGMEYMLRPPERLCDPLVLLPSAKTAAVFTINYPAAPVPELPQGFGRVARYAWGKDYHRVLKRRLTSLLGALASELGVQPEARIFSDAVPLLERALAARSGRLLRGSNSMLIDPEGGSFFLLAELLWNVEVHDAPAAGTAAGCGDCGACESRCPTHAITAPGRLDARRCISYLTIEKRGVLSSDERRAVGEWIFGCDLCQEVCPFNAGAADPRRDAALPELTAAEGCGPFLELKTVLELRSDEAFKQHFAGTALMRAGREGLLRNAAIVAANTRAHQTMDALLAAAEEDASCVVRLHALWAAAQLYPDASAVRRDQIRLLVQRAQKDHNGDVSCEAQRLWEDELE